MIFLDFLKVKKIMKICSKTHQIAPLKYFFSGKHAPNPLANAWLRHASQTPPPPKKKIDAPLGKSCIRRMANKSTTEKFI